VRKLDHPIVDDDDLLNQLRVSRSPHAIQVSTRHDEILDRYRIYRQHQGNPWTVAEDVTFETLRVSLNHLYQYPPKALSFIDSLRAEVEGACPVCGRDGIGTLDHYLPKADYSEFSFLSLNLVPACSRCNTARKNLVRGANPGERPVHPYFDAFALRRVMTIRAEPDWRAPRLTPVPWGVADDELAVVQWHIENVVRPSGIDTYVAHLWGTLTTRPAPFLGREATRDAVHAQLLRQIELEEAVGGSPNAWRACFYHGLSTNEEAMEHLVSLL